MASYDGTSLYERNHPMRYDQTFGIVMGQITDVFPEERMASVVTFGGHPSQNDHFLEKVQWLSLDANVEGDETGSIPRKNSLCLVFTVGGVPFIWGFFKPQGKAGIAKLGNEFSKLIEGDKIMSTAAGNRLVVKSNGSIELFGKDNLRRVMYPKGSVINDLCRKYELSSDGGDIVWEAAPLTGAALFRQEFKQNVTRANIIVEEKGAVSGATLIERKTIGLGTPATPKIPAPLYSYEYDLITGISAHVKFPGPLSGVKWTVNPLGKFQVTAGPQGNFDFSVEPTGAAKFTINKIYSVGISAAGAFTFKNPAVSSKVSETGDTEFKTPFFTATIKKTGEVEIKNNGATIKVSASGEVTIDAKGKAKLSAAAIDIMSMGPLKIDAKGPVDVKAMGPISLAGGGMAATDFVLCNPTTVSQFTGAPLVPFSTTVKVSK